MDALKQKLNDIGSCIGYPFYFFEDGTFSHTFVCGKMNAVLVVKGPFAESEKCFWASNEVASISGIKAMEKKWAAKSDEADKVNLFKKYLNDIGDKLHYPFYVFDDGAYAKASSLEGKQTVLYVKRAFTSVKGEGSFFSTDSKKVLQFEEDFKKLKKQQNERKNIVFRMLAGERVSDREALQVIENEPHDLVRRCVGSVWKKNGFYWEFIKKYPNSFDELIKKNYWDIYCFDKQEFKHFCLNYIDRKYFFTLFFQYATPEILEKILKICLKGNFSYAVAKKYSEVHAKRDICDYRRRTAQYFRPLYLIERHDVEAYKVYRKYVIRKYLMYDYCDFYQYYHRYKTTLDFHCDEEISAIVDAGATDLLMILLQGVHFTSEQKAKLVQAGNIEMLQTYIKCCGIDSKFRELLLNSGDDELVKLARVNVIVNTLTRVKHFCGKLIRTYSIV